MEGIGGGGTVRRSDLARLGLLRGNVGKDRGAAFGKDLVPEFGKSPCYGKDDALSNQDTENVSRNLPTICNWIQELVGVKVLACMSDIRQTNVQANGENADREVQPGNLAGECQQNFRQGEHRVEDVDRGVVPCFVRCREGIGRGEQGPVGDGDNKGKGGNGCV